MVEITKLGTATHSTKIDSGCYQVDKIKVNIPLSLLTEEAQNLLNYWCVEEFNFAEIDWAEDEIVLYYRTSHFLPGPICAVDMNEAEKDMED